MMRSTEEITHVFANPHSLVLNLAQVVGQGLDHVRMDLVQGETSHAFGYPFLKSWINMSQL
jgi:hypothetical protein